MYLQERKWEHLSFSLHYRIYWSNSKRQARRREEKYLSARSATVCGGLRAQIYIRSKHSRGTKYMWETRNRGEGFHRLPANFLPGRPEATLREMQRRARSVLSIYLFPVCDNLSLSFYLSGKCRGVSRTGSQSREPHTSRYHVYCCSLEHTACSLQLSSRQDGFSTEMRSFRLHLLRSIERKNPGKCRDSEKIRFFLFLND